MNKIKVHYLALSTFFLLMSFSLHNLFFMFKDFLTIRIFMYILGLTCIFLSSICGIYNLLKFSRYEKSFYLTAWVIIFIYILYLTVQIFLFFFQLGLLLPN